MRGLNGCDGLCTVGEFGLVDAMNWGLVKFRHDVNSTVDPRYCAQRSPRVVPDRKGTSHTTSIDFAFIPTTTPLTERGTPPES